MAIIIGLNLGIIANTIPHAINNTRIDGKNNSIIIFKLSLIETGDKKRKNNANNNAKN